MYKCNQGKAVRRGGGLRGVCAPFAREAWLFAIIVFGHWCVSSAYSSGFGAGASCPMPAVFVENGGQAPEASVRYILNGNGATVYYGKGGCMFMLPGPRGKAGTATDSVLSFLPAGVDESREVSIVSVSFPGAKSVLPVGVEQAAVKMHYYRGGAAPYRDLRTFRGVVYPGLYDGIDLHVLARRSHVKYEFHVRPGADYREIQIRYEGAERLSVDEEGAIHVVTAAGRLIDRPPYIYRLLSGRPEPLRGAYRLIDDCTYGFEIFDAVSADDEIVIDPELIWSCFVGGNDYDYALGVGVDSRGNVVIAGDTRSNVLHGAATSAGADAFVASLDESGELRWITCIGGRGGDSALNLAVDAWDNIWVTGLTASDDMPLRTNQYGGGTDAFVAKLDAEGNLLWTTYLGGSSTDQGFGIAVDDAGNAMAAGYTESKDFRNRLNSYRGGSFDGFAAAVSCDGAVMWATYIGWLGSDYCSAAAIDGAGNWLVTGTTSSATLPQALNSRYGADDAFVAMINPEGVLQQSRFLGGTRADRGCGIAVSRWGQILVAGDTESTDFVGGKNSSHGRKDAFISILDTLDGQVQTTYFGGDGIDGAWAIAEDTLGNIIISGSTYSQSLASSDNAYTAGQEAFVAAFSAAGTLLFSTYLGGGGDDCGFGVAVDGANRIVVTGSSGSANFIGAEGFNGGSRDGFVVKLAGVSGTAPDLVVTQALAGITGVAGECVSVAVQVENTGRVDAVAYGPGYFSTAVYLADRADIKWDELGGDAVVGRFNLARLDSGAVHEAVVEIDAPADAGVYYLRARTDDFDSVPEEREYNNWGQIVKFTVSEPVGLPDLVAAAPGLESISVIRGRTVAVGIEIKNVGDGDAVASVTPFSTGLYLAAESDADWESLTESLGAIERTILAAGASYATDISFTAGMEAGTYYLRVKADTGDAIAERDEENNWSNVVTLNVMEAPLLADLTIVGDPEMAISSTCGHGVNFMAEIQNIGDANAVGAGSAPIRAALYIANYAGANWEKLGNQNRIATVDVQPLEVGGADWVTFVFDAPVEEGLYCLRAKVDVTGVVEEVSEQNNWGPVVTFIVDDNALPDIVASFVEAGDISKRPFESVDVSVEIVNAGAGRADPADAEYFETLVFLTGDDGTDDNSVGLLQTGVLEPSEAQQGTIRFAAPGRRGVYYLQARTDIGDCIGESNEYNNLTRRIRLVVEGSPLDNQPPVFVRVNPQIVAEGQTLTFSVVAIDPEGDVLTYLAVSRPSGASFVDGVFTWTPDYDQAGSYKVLFYVSDGESSDWQAVDITVTNTNRPPVISVPAAAAVDEGQLATFAVSASDADGDVLVHRADNLPAGATFVDGVFSWTPTYGQAGEYVVVFSVSDGHADNGEASASVLITVNDVNRPPVARAGGDRAADDLDGDGFESVLLDGRASYDPDGDVLTYRWTDAGGRVLAAEAAPVVSFAVGVHVVTLTVTDARGSSSAETVTIEIRRVNRPPVARAGGDRTVIDYDEDGIEMIVLDGSASSDPDGVIVAWQWLLYNTVIGSGAVREIPLSIGTFTLTLRVSDDSGAVGEDTFTVTVIPPPVNTAPVFAPIGSRTIKENERLTFAVEAEDAEGDSITLSASNLPENATFADGVFAFRPWYDQSGVYTIVFTASDGRAQSTVEATIIVEDVVLTDWYRAWLESMRR